MVKKLRFLLNLLFFLWSTNYLVASNSPLNDSVCDAIDLGMLPVPIGCPNNPSGDTIMFSGSTANATFNPLDFSVTHCFPSGSPDVWYKFRAPASHLDIQVIGSNGLNNFFVKLHHSQGSCLSLVPLECVTSTFGILNYTFPTPALSGDYYLEIGGGSVSQTGDFLVIMKSFLDCNGCVKHGDVLFAPAPTFGQYNAGDTVSMCTTVSHWEALSTSHLHSIVPEFGPDWDTLSIIPTLIPFSINATNGWHWMNAVQTPSGTHSGFFYDSDNDGDPTNNSGDQGNILTTWTGCWKIRTKVQCMTNDLSVDIHLYSDAETGNGNPNFICDPYDVIHVSTAMNCCPSPIVTISNSGGCLTGTSLVTVMGGGPNASTHFFNYYIVDTSMNVIQSALNIIGPNTFTGLSEGQYIVIAEDVTIGGCQQFQTITIQAGLVLNVQQTVVSCAPGAAQAIVSVVSGGSGYYHYSWLNIPSTNQWDSLGFNLPDGWVLVSVYDTIQGCTSIDSVFIITEPTPDATFGYGNTIYCFGVDTIQVTNQPISPGGVYVLVSPQTAGITVDPFSGIIFLNNTTFAPPFYIVVQYYVGINCQSYYTDSVLVAPIPAAPTPTSQATFNYCIGSGAPLLSVNVSSTSTAVWYDVQTSNYTAGNSFNPPLNGSSSPGTYLYLAVSVANSTGCTSASTFFVVNAYPNPSITSTSDTSICTGDVVNLSATGCSTCTYYWLPTPTAGPDNMPNTSTYPTTTTTYTVSAVDAIGCASAAYTTILVDAGGLCHLQVYSGLTPNNDGANDFWMIDGIDGITDLSVSIYNRWGTEVWHGDHYDNVNVVWKGEDKNGNQLPDATYYYIITSSSYSTHNWVELSH